MNCNPCTEESSLQLHIVEARKKTKKEEGEEEEEGNQRQEEVADQGEKMLKDREKGEEEEEDFGERRGEEEAREVHAEDSHEDADMTGGGEEEEEEEEESLLPLEDRQRFLCILSKLLLLPPSSPPSLTEREKDNESPEEKEGSTEKNKKEYPAFLLEKKEETSETLQKDSLSGGVYVQRRGEEGEEEEEFSNSFEAELCSLWDAAADVQYARFLGQHHLLDLLLLLLRQFILPSLEASQTREAEEESRKIEREEEEEEEKALRRRDRDEEKIDPLVPSAPSASSSSSSLRDALPLDRFAEIFCGCLANLFSHTEVFHEALQHQILLSSSASSFSSSSTSRLLSLDSSSLSSQAEASFFPREACRYLLDLVLLSSDARTLREAFRALSSLLYALHRRLPSNLQSLLLRETSPGNSSSSVSSSVSSSCSVLTSGTSTSSSSSPSLSSKEREEEEEEECVQARHLLLKALFSLRYSLHSELIASSCGYLEALLTVVLDCMEDGELKARYKSSQSYPDRGGHAQAQLSGVRTLEKAGVHTPREQEEVSSLRKASESKGDDSEGITAAAQRVSEKRSEEKESEVLFNRRLFFPSLSSYYRVLSDLISLREIDKTLQKVCYFKKDREGSETERDEDPDEGLENLGFVSSILLKTSELLGLRTAPLVSPQQFHEILTSVLLQSRESQDISRNGWTVGCTYTRQFTRKALQQISVDLRLSKEERPGEEEEFHEGCEGEGVLFHSLFSLLDTTLAYLQERERSGTEDQDITREGREIDKTQFLICLLQLSLRCLSVCTEDAGLCAALLLLLRVFLEARSIDASQDMKIENEKNRNREQEEEEELKDLLKRPSSSIVNKTKESLEEREVLSEKSSFEKRREKEEDRGNTGGRIENGIKPTGREVAERRSSSSSSRVSLEQEFEVYIHLFLRNECSREVIEKLVLLRQEEEVLSNPDTLLGILFVSQFSSRETLKDLEPELLEITQAHIRATQKQGTKRLSGVHTPERSQSGKQPEEEIREENQGSPTGEKEAFCRQEEEGYYYTMPELLSDAFLKYLLRLC